LIINSEDKEAQLKRIRQLKEFVVLEEDNYDNLLSLQSTNKDDLFFNRIMQREIESVLTQTNEEGGSITVQTNDMYACNIAAYQIMHKIFLLEIV